MLFLIFFLEFLLYNFVYFLGFVFVIQFIVVVGKTCLLHYLAFKGAQQQLQCISGLLWLGNIPGKKMQEFWLKYETVLSDIVMKSHF